MSSSKIIIAVSIIVAALSLVACETDHVVGGFPAGHDLAGLDKPIK